MHVEAGGGAGSNHHNLVAKEFGLKAFHFRGALLRIDGANDLPQWNALISVAAGRVARKGQAVVGMPEQEHPLILVEWDTLPLRNRKATFFQTRIRLRGVAVNKICTAQRKRPVRARPRPKENRNSTYRSITIKRGIDVA